MLKYIIEIPIMGWFFFICFLLIWIIIRTERYDLIYKYDPFKYMFRKRYLKCLYRILYHERTETKMDFVVNDDQTIDISGNWADIGYGCRIMANVNVGYILRFDRLKTYTLAEFFVKYNEFVESSLDTKKVKYRLDSFGLTLDQIETSEIANRIFNEEFPSIMTIPHKEIIQSLIKDNFIAERRSDVMNRIRYDVTNMGVDHLKERTSVLKFIQKMI